MSLLAIQGRFKFFRIIRATTAAVMSVAVFLLSLGGWLLVMPQIPAQAKIGSDISDGYIKILKWDETVYINPNSRRNVIRMTGRAERVKANTYIKNWIYSITDSAIQQGKASFVVEYATVNGRPAVFVPSNGSISIDVDKAINGKTLNVEFAYQVINRQEQPFYRVEQLFFGGFLVGTPVKYTVIVDRSLIMCSVPEYFLTTDHYTYQWQGKVTAEMRNQSFHVTRSYGLWFIRTGFAISALEVPTKFLEIRTPRLFNEGSQVIMSNKITPSTQPTLATNKDAYYLFQFKNLQTSELSLIMETAINNTKHLGSSASYSTSDYGSLSSADRLLLDQAVTEIRRQHTERINSGSNVPLFVSAGEWVHHYLTYDLQSVGKNTDLKTILQTKRGVCEHYAILFTAICRALNMPAFHVSGFAYSETDRKFIGHAWNFVYSNGKWYEVDPTWNLMSGVVPLSHIIFQKGENKETQFRSTAEADYHIQRITDIQYLGEKEGQLNPKNLSVEMNVQKTPGSSQSVPRPTNAPTLNRRIGAAISSPQSDSNRQVRGAPATATIPTSPTVPGVGQVAPNPAQPIPPAAQGINETINNVSPGSATHTQNTSPTTAGLATGDSASTSDLQRLEQVATPSNSGSVNPPDVQPSVDPNPDRNSPVTPSIGSTTGANPPSQYQETSGLSATSPDAAVNPIPANLPTTQPTTYPNPAMNSSIAPSAEPNYIIYQAR